MIKRSTTNRSTPEAPADPHPSNEEKYDQIRHPGGANPPKGADAGVEVARHSGQSPPRPKNAETER